MCSNWETVQVATHPSMTWFTLSSTGHGHMAPACIHSPTASEAPTPRSHVTEDVNSKSPFLTCAVMHPDGEGPRFPSAPPETPLLHRMPTDGTFASQHQLLRSPPSWPHCVFSGSCGTAQCSPHARLCGRHTTVSLTFPTVYTLLTWAGSTWHQGLCLSQLCLRSISGHLWMPPRDSLNV